MRFVGPAVWPGVHTFLKWFIKLNDFEDFVSPFDPQNNSNEKLKATHTERAGHERVLGVCVVHVVKQELLVVPSHTNN